MPKEYKELFYTDSWVIKTLLYIGLLLTAYAFASIIHYGLQVVNHRQFWVPMITAYLLFGHAWLFSWFVFFPKKEWGNYRNGVSEYQEIIDDKLITEKLYYKDKFITPELLKKDMNAFTYYFGRHPIYFRAALKSKKQVISQKPVSIEEKREVTLAEKEFKINSLTKDIEILGVEEEIAKIKKRTAVLFKTPTKKMTPEEKLLDREIRKDQYLKVVKEVAKNKSPEEQDILFAEAYQEIERIK